ncbi:MAG TPA: AMP-binding protein [Gemmatimonadaceae bacterium]|nr:AMP-binding protein [Gemmatimonadaceae bacterium]
MTNPLSLLPLAIAAGRGRVDDFEAQQLIAAGLTLLQRSAPLVRALSGRRAAILLPTSPAFLTALAACEGRGAVLVNPLAAPAEIAFQCADANVGAVFTTEPLAARVPAELPRVLLDHAPRMARVVAHGVAREIDLGSHHGLSLEGERDLPGRDEEAAIVYTSAMRGIPLGAVLTHANLLANARATITAMEYGADDRVLALLPWSHLFGLTVTGAAALMAGAHVVTMERFHPVKAVEHLASRITVMVGVPSVYHALLNVCERRGIDLRDSALRICVCGGAELPASLQDRWATATGVELRQGYGLTEAGPVCLFNDLQHANARGTLGRPYPGVDVAIFPPADYSPSASVPPGVAPMLPDGEVGEICVRGPGVFRGYVHDADAGLPRRGEWLCTGDRGVKNADGTITFLGLLKPMFTRNGFNVYPRELERAVAELRDVHSARVRAVPDPVKENEILLHVEGNATEEEIRRWCEWRLSAYKQPSAVEITPTASTPSA